MAEATAAVWKILVFASAIEALPIVGAISGAPVAGFQNFGRALTARARPGGWILAIVIAASYVLFALRSDSLVARYAFVFDSLKILAVAAAAIAAITEEFIFRRLLIESFLRRIGAIPSILISGVLFGTAHSAWVLLGGSGVGAAAAFTTTLLGIGLAACYFLSGRHLLPCIVAHFFIDAVIEPGTLLAAVSAHPLH